MAVTGRLVAVGTTNTDNAATSDNGTDWTLQPYAPSLPGTQRAIAWAPSLGKACVINSVNVPPTVSYFDTTSDGITWTASATSYTGQYNTIAWSPELSLFCAIATNRDSMVSSDGVTWSTPVTLSATFNASSGVKVCWAASLGLFVAVARTPTSGLARAATSPDGATWTIQAFPSVSGSVAVENVAWSPTLGLAVAVGFNIGTNNRIATSPDGATWTWRSGGGGTLYSVAWSTPLGMFCAVGATGAIYTSTDGTSWTARTSGTTMLLQEVCWSDELGVFCAVANQATSGGTPMSVVSSDGVTWSLATSGLLFPNRGTAVCAITLGARRGRRGLGLIRG